MANDFFKYGFGTQDALRAIKKSIEDKTYSVDLSYLNLHSLPPMPPEIKHINFSSNNITKINNLPDDLESLSSSSTQLNTIKSFPKNLKSLRIYNSNLCFLPTLPDSLEKISIYNDENDVNNLNLKIPNVPKSLKTFYSNIMNLQQRHYDESFEEFKKRLIEYIEQESKKNSIQRCKAVKEELMAITWHPKRYQSWCLDIQEQEFDSKERTIQEWMDFEM